MPDHDHGTVRVYECSTELLADLFMPQERSGRTFLILGWAAVTRADFDRIDQELGDAITKLSRVREQFADAADSFVEGPLLPPPTPATPA